MTTYDAVVVGGRVAGASTAMLLARAGARVLLLERAAYGSDTLSTHGLMRAGVLQLSRWGLLTRSSPPARRPVTRTCSTTPAQAARAHLDPAQPRRAALYAPRRHVLDRILVDAAVEAGRRGAARDPRDRTCSPTRRPGHGRARRRRGRRPVTASRADDDRRRRHQVDRRAPPSTRRPALRRATGECRALRLLRRSPDRGLRVGLRLRRRGGLIPTNDGQTCVFVGTTPERLRSALDGPDATPRSPSCSAAPRPGCATGSRAATRVGRLHGWSGQPGHIRRSDGPGWALVGDAGYFRDPITTHGMTDALRDAELLADALLETLGRATPEAIALAGYQAKRDALSSAQLFEVSDRIAAYDWAPTRSTQLLREVSSAMSDEVGHLQSLPRGCRSGCAGMDGIALADMRWRRSLALKPSPMKIGTGMDARHHPPRRLLGRQSAAPWSPTSSGAVAMPASLVKLLALADGRRLHREQVIDALWPDLSRSTTPARGCTRRRTTRGGRWERRARGSSCATTSSSCCRTTTSPSTPSSSARRPRRPSRSERPTTAGAGARATCTPASCCPTTSTSRGPRSTASRWRHSTASCCA